MVNGTGTGTVGASIAAAYLDKPIHGTTTNGPISPEQLTKLSEAEIKNLKKAGKVECGTCQSRRYVDGSDDPGVSFKTPTKVAPEQAASKVLSHERQHYSREGAEAKRENREVVSNTIRLNNAICPECGRAYVSGGETRTVTKSKPEPEFDYDKKSTFDMMI